MGEFVWDVRDWEELVSGGRVREKVRWEMRWIEAGELPMELVQIWSGVVTWKFRRMEKEKKGRSAP